MQLWKICRNWWKWVLWGKRESKVDLDDVEVMAEEEKNSGAKTQQKRRANKFMANFYSKISEVSKLYENEKQTRSQVVFPANWTPPPPPPFSIPRS